jgi:hypothetical protein
MGKEKDPLLFRLVAVSAFIVIAEAGLARTDPPLPPPRPAEAPSPAPSPADQPQASPSATQADAPAAAPEMEDTCLADLKAAGFEVDSAEQPQASNELCRIETPVRLKAIPVPTKPGTAVRLTGQPLLACRFADRFGHWVGALVAPVIADIKSTELKAVRTGPGFQCRNRNRAANGKLSVHAQGLALDISAFDLADGSALWIRPEPDAAPDPALASVRKAACGWFTTILGPGTDKAHHDHLHVDIERHGSTDLYRICN